MRERSRWSDAVAATIRAERAAAGDTQEELAAKAGLPRSTYIRLETGQRVADIQQLDRICTALRLDIAEFMRRAKARLPQTADM